MKISRSIAIETKDKPGRNDPCFCNSGKKYKRCHLLIEESQRVILPNHNKVGLIAAAVDWATLQPWYESTFKKMFGEIFGVGKQTINEEESKSLSETVLFEGKVSGGKTPIQLFVEQAQLSVNELKLFQRWLDEGRFGGWVVEEIYLGQGFRVSEFMGKDEYLISEHLASFSISPGDVIVCRLLPFEGGWMLGGGVGAKLPEVWIYEFKKSKLKFNFSSAEFMKLWFKGKASGINTEKNYEELKKELFDFVIREELPFNIDNFDERLKEAGNPSIFFYPLYKSLFWFSEKMDYASDLTAKLWNKGFEKIPKKEDKAFSGQIELALSNDFGKYCTDRFEKEEVLDPNDQIQLSRVWIEEWLDKKQKALNFMTPRQVMIEERRKRGDESTGFKIDSTAFFWPKHWQEASDLHELGLAAFKKRDFNRAHQDFANVIIQYPDFPHKYRTLANLGMCELSLGNKKAGVMLLEQALLENPRYSFAKGRLEAVKNISEQQIKKDAGLLQMEQAFKKLAGRVKKVQSKRERGWVKKGG